MVTFVNLRFLFTLLIITLLCQVNANIVSAANSSFVTIVNPIRISPYTKDPVETIKTQYSIVNSQNIAATWLLTYDVIKNDDSSEFFKTIRTDHEVGIFLEVTPELCHASGVTCNKGSWHHANVIFLSGYTQADRIKLINTVFEEFYTAFGFYPKAVGSWWTDAYSLTYMRETYGITTNLTCSDQFSTDGYQIWGQYWMHPFYPSKNHAGVPAYDLQSQIGVVTIQWASREPLRGYESSLYSTQDYQTHPLSFSTDYFEQLLKTYGYKNQNSFGQITVGLEGDYNPADYLGEFTNQIKLVKEYVNSNKLSAVTMSQFSDWFRNNNHETPMSFTNSDAFNSTNKSFWISTKRYRIGLTYDTETKSTTIIDLRTYHPDFREPYYISPNNEHELSIYIPSQLDWANNNENVWELSLGELQNVKREGDTVTFLYANGQIIASDSTIQFTKDGLVLPPFLQSSKVYDIKTSNDTIKIAPKEKWFVPVEGILFTNLSQAGTNELARRRTRIIIVLSTLLYVGLLLFVTKKIVNRKNKVLTITILTLAFFSVPYVWYQRNVQTYYVSQAELDALSVLSNLPSGKVLIYDKKCLGCQWSTPHKYAVYENNRSYVSNFSKMQTVQNQRVFEATTQQDARHEFQGLNATYIYLVKYEEYQEKIPFSPGDLNIEKIYDNANAEIWRIIN